MSSIYLFVVLNGILILSQTPNIKAKGLLSIFFNRGRLLTPEKGCGISQVANTKIVGGTEAKPGAYPWMALLGETRVINGDGSTAEFFSCGGTLITTRHVLTAAHCLTVNLTFVRLGEHDYSVKQDKNRQDIAVIKTTPHPKYNKTDKTSDIAILTLELDADINDRVRPICLPLSEELRSRSFVGESPFLTGWGTTTSMNGSWSKVLMEVQLSVIENDKCKDLYSRYALDSNIKFSNLVLCAGKLAGGQDGCRGDSGGPLMMPILENNKFHTYQIGVVAWGVGCALPDTPGVYTRVSEFIDWIKEVVQSEQ